MVKDVKKEEVLDAKEKLLEEVGKVCVEKNGKKYFEIINDYLNSLSTKYAKIIIKDDSLNKSIKIYDNYYNDEVTKKSFIRKHETYHLIEWNNYGTWYDDDDESLDSVAHIGFKSHYYTKEGTGKAEKSTICVMPYLYAEKLFAHAERIACLKSIRK